MILEDILKKLGLDYEDLSDRERKTYESWANALETKPLTVEEIGENIRQARESVEMELVSTPEMERYLWWYRPTRQHVFLKARLMNYLMIEAFLKQKEVDKKLLEKQLQQINGL